MWPYSRSRIVLVTGLSLGWVEAPSPEGPADWSDTVKHRHISCLTGFLPLPIVVPCLRPPSVRKHGHTAGHGGLHKYASSPVSHWVAKAWFGPRAQISGIPILCPSMGRGGIRGFLPIVVNTITQEVVIRTEVAHFCEEKGVLSKRRIWSKRAWTECTEAESF